MNDEINYKNNPLHGLSLKNLLIEIVDHYGFEILFAYLNINCFKTNPSIESSVKFLKKTDWAREKVEVFYLYKFKSLPRVSSEQFALPPRERIIPEGQTPGEPAELSLEDAERVREKKAKKTAEYGKSAGHRSGKNYGAKRGGNSSNRDDDDPWKNSRKASNSRSSSVRDDSDPWASWRK
ncbi:MAG: VF530 family DNA-binding protein [Amphritea sp.]